MKRTKSILAVTSKQNKPKKENSMSNKPRSEIRTVTPEWAQQILNRHEESIAQGKFRQRPLNLHTVKKYATDMKAGNWALTGQGISFDNAGNLLDGQHRIAAVASSGVSLQMLVMWDLEPENNGVKTINLCDIGKNRNISQQLKINGVSYYNQIGTGARALLTLSRGNIHTRPSLPQVMAVAALMENNMMKMLEVLITNNQLTKGRGFILAPLTLLSTSEPDSAEMFAMEFNEMANLGKTSPVLHFARFLDRPTHAKGGHDYARGAMKALCSALYLYCNEKKVEQRITGNDEHVEWLLKVSKNTVSKIREVAGIELTMEELQQKG
jgi:hypothetical protein